MADMSLSFESYLDACSEELERTLDALEVAGPDVPVPTCPGWTTGDLAAHLRQVYGRWRQRLADGGTVVLASSERAGAAGTSEGAGATAPPPADGFYDEGSALLAELAAVGPEAACWNWTGVDETAAWLARRIALETTVHRVDAELAAGTSRPVEAELAVDGIEERLEVHLRPALARSSRAASLGGTVCLVCSDVDAAYVVEAGGGQLRWRRGRGPADAALVGTASQLFLFSWNRFPVEALSLTGRQEVVAAWADLPG